MKTYQDRDEYNFDFEQGACCALAALLSPRQGFQPNRWRESLACITEIGNLDTWEVSRGALMRAHPNGCKKRWEKQDQESCHL